MLTTLQSANILLPSTDEREIHLRRITETHAERAVPKPEYGAPGGAIGSGRQSARLRQLIGSSLMGALPSWASSYDSRPSSK
jgi:hypothetical protein